jgi:hypothetical protein
MFICDLGVKHFCYIITDGEVVEDFNVVPINCINDLVQLLRTHTTRDDTYLIERQLNRNVKCAKLQAALETFCVVTNKRYRLVNPKHKYTRLPIEYVRGKRTLVTYGDAQLNDLNASDELKARVRAMKKRDDFYDCVYMWKTTEL